MFEKILLDINQVPSKNDVDWLNENDNQNRRSNIKKLVGKTNLDQLSNESKEIH